jgi:hypothetical protein
VSTFLIFCPASFQISNFSDASEKFCINKCTFSSMLIIVSKNTSNYINIGANGDDGEGDDSN